jgi:hypothetical protein
MDFRICDSIFMRKLCLHVKCAEALVLLGSFFFQLFYMLYSARTRRENMESCVWSCPVVTRLRASGSDAGNCLRATAPPSQSSKARVEEHSYGRVSSGPHRRLTSKTLSIAFYMFGIRRGRTASFVSVISLQALFQKSLHLLSEL